eukprot:Rhum_TRINITY_DN21425_c0_g1::Rhum_TRINITY_DN21425_c0_g1_i1::g.174050::m.174050/K11878/PSMG4, PAC4; proteasome assembly chaperone 4
MASENVDVKPHLADACEGETAGNGFVIHDFAHKFYEGKQAVVISFRLLVREKLVWIWLGDAPLLSNASVHVSTPFDILPSGSRIIDDDRHDFGYNLGNRLTKSLSGHIVHVNYHLTPERLNDPMLGSMMEKVIVKNLREQGIVAPKQP